MQPPQEIGKNGRTAVSPVVFSVVLFVAAFLIRFVFVLALRDWTVGPNGIVSADDVEFDQFAKVLAAGDGYVNREGQPSSFRAPGFPIFLSGVYRVSGVNYPVAYVVFCLLGALGCVLTYGLAREFVSESWARAAGLLSVFYLPHIYFSTIFYSEVLFVPCLTAAVWLYIRYVRSAKLMLIAIAGLLFGWSTLVRPYALLFLPIFGLLLLYLQWPVKRRALISAALFALSFLAVISPWTLRNYSVHGRFVLIATNGGSTFYGANNHRVATELRYLGSWLSTTELPHRDWIDAQPDEVSHDKMEWKLGMDWIRENPQYLPLMSICKLGRLWIWPPDFDRGFRLLRTLAYLPYWIIMTFGAVCCLRHSWGWKFPWLVLHGVILATIVTALVFWGCTRFRDANMPFLMCYAVVGLQFFSRMIESRKRKSAQRIIQNTPPQHTIT